MKRSRMAISQHALASSAAGCSGTPPSARRRRSWPPGSRRRESTQPGIAQQHDQRGPVPDIHHDDGDPGGDRLAGCSCSRCRGRCQRMAEQADVRQRPKICQIVPTTFHGMSSGRAIRTRQTEHPGALLRHGQRDDDAERDLDRQDDGRKRAIWRQKRAVEAVGMQQLARTSRCRPRRTRCCRRCPAPNS